jgi:SGNH hydrolase-like domain, acetyltransferase AlgX
VPLRAVGLVALALVSGLGTLLVSEAALRLTPYRAFLRADQWPQHYYRADRERGYDISPNASTSTHRFADGAFPIWSNELGCFDRPYAGETPYVYLAGDSFAWGFAPFEDKWGTRLEALSGVRVLKCGVAGYGTKQELAKARQVISTLSTPPKLVIVAYFGNDLHDDEASPRKLVYNGRLLEWPDEAPRDDDAMQAKLPEIYERAEKYCNGNRRAHPAVQRAKCLLSRHSIVYELMTLGVKRWLSIDLLRRVGAVNESIPAVDRPPTNDAAYATHFDTVASFREFAASQGARFLVVFVPLGEEAPVPTDVPVPADLYPRLKTYFHARDIEYLDLTEDFRRVHALGGGPLYWPRDAHWNVRGNRLAGLLVARHVLEHSSWIPARDERLAAVKRALRQEFAGLP